MVTVSQDSHAPKSVGKQGENRQQTGSGSKETPASIGTRPGGRVRCGSRQPRAKFAHSFMGTTYEGTISPHQNRRATVPLTHWREGGHQAIHESGAIREMDGGSESEDR
jgi:hypothetical protein